ncbi:MAG: insulinase family protein [Myxococcales bacterium]|nr:insulinase family protein [Myxococcales bacterium]
MGYFPLPAPLAIDPRNIAIPGLDFGVIKPEPVRLDNGLVVYLSEDHAAPLITLRALVWAGSVDEPAEKLGVADLTFDLLATGGAGGIAADALDELLEYYAADAAGGASDEYSTFSLNLRSADLGRLFPVFADMLLRPRFQRDRFEIALGRFVEGVRRRPDSPEGLAYRALEKAVFGPDAPFGREHTEKTLRAISLEEVRAFHRRAVVPKAVLLLASGDFDRSELIDLVRRHFGEWKGGERHARDLGGPSKLGRRVLFVPKDTAQARIRIGGHGFQRLSPREYSIRVANTAIGSAFVGRLYREVRDAKGLAYSAYSAVHPGPTGGMFFAGADTRPGAAAQAIEAILQVLAGAAGSNPISKAEVSSGADMFLNSFAFRFDSAEKIVREKAVFDLFGYPQDYLDTFRDRIAEVDERAALEAIRSLVREEELQIVVVGPGDRIGDLSRFGPVTTIADVEAFR